MRKARTISYRGRDILCREDSLYEVRYAQEIETIPHTFLFLEDALEDIDEWESQCED